MYKLLKTAYKKRKILPDTAEKIVMSPELLEMFESAKDFIRILI